MALGYPHTDGDRQSFASIEARFKDKVYFIHAINYSRERSRGVVLLNHPDPMGKTKGTNAYKADAEMLLAEFEELKKDLGEGDNGDGYGDKYFTVVVTFTENGLDTITDELLGCTLDSTDASNAQGDDATMRKFNLNPVKIKFGQADDCATPLKAPPDAA